MILNNTPWVQSHSTSILPSGVNQESAKYLEEYSGSVNVIVLEDSITAEQLWAFCETIKPLQEGWLGFVLTTNTMNGLSWLVNDDMEMSEILDLESGAIHRHARQIWSILTEGKVDVSMILWGQWRNTGYFREQYDHLYLDIDAIQADCKAGKVPLILPFIRDKGSIVPVDWISFATSTAIEIGAAKLIIPTTNSQAISNFSMLRLSEAKNILETWGLPYLCHRYLTAMVSFIESDVANARAHFVPVPSDIMTEILTIDWADSSTMVSSTKFHQIPTEWNVYHQGSIQR